MKQASFKFKFDSPDDARIVAVSLSPEIKHKIPKTKVSLSHSEKGLKISIESPDMSSLRAACNSYLRWVNTALSVKKVI